MCLFAIAIISFLVFAAGLRGLLADGVGNQFPAARCCLRKRPDVRRSRRSRMGRGDCGHGRA